MLVVNEPRFLPYGGRYEGARAQGVIEKVSTYLDMGGLQVDTILVGERDCLRSWTARRSSISANCQSSATGKSSRSGSSSTMLAIWWTAGRPRTAERYLLTRALPHRIAGRPPHRRSSRLMVKPSASKSIIERSAGVSRNLCFITRPTPLRGSSPTTST
jgi:hypothetical protein